MICADSEVASLDAAGMKYFFFNASGSISYEPSEIFCYVKSDSWSLFWNLDNLQRTVKTLLHVWFVKVISIGTSHLKLDHDLLEQVTRQRINMFGG